MVRGTRAAIITTALVLGACGGDPSNTPTVEGTPTTIEAVQEGSYGSVHDMREDVESTGYECRGAWKVYDPPLGEDTLEQADCSQHVVFLIYEEEDVQTNVAEIQRKVNDLLGLKSTLLVGNNWIINCGPQQVACETIQMGTGGELVITHP